MVQVLYFHVQEQIWEMIWGLKKNSFPCLDVFLKVCDLFSLWNWDKSWQCWGQKTISEKILTVLPFHILPYCSICFALGDRFPLGMFCRMLFILMQLFTVFLLYCFSEAYANKTLLIFFCTLTPLLFLSGVNFLSSKKYFLIIVTKDIWWKVPAMYFPFYYKFKFLL